MANADDVLKLLEQRHGIFLKKSFYNSWYQSQSHSSSAPPHVERLYTGIFKHFLNSDMATCTEPFLQKKGIQQKMVLQLQHTTDMSSSLYHLTDALDKNGPISRGNLKWIMTDGDCDIIVFELNKIPSMNLKTPFGSKVQITSGLYASGILLVKPENFQLLGGQIPELYGDTMENELLRRYRKQLQLQSSTEPERTTRATPRPTTASIPTYQNNIRATPTPTTTSSNRASSNNTARSTPQTTSNTLTQQPNSSTAANGTANSDDFDDEFDYWPTDDLDDLEELEQQATTAANNSTYTTNNSHPTHYSRESDHLIAMDDEFSQRPTSSIHHPCPSTDTSTIDPPKRRPTLSLSTKSKHNVNTNPPAISTPATIRPSPPTNGTPATTRPSPPAYIDLDNTPSPPLRPTTSPRIQQTVVSDNDDMMFDDLPWTDSREQGNTMTEAPGRILSVSEFSTLLKSVDDSSFIGNFDKVSVQIQGCHLLKMKPLANDGLHLTVELSENCSNEKRMLVDFVYIGIDSLFEGYTLEEVWRIKRKQGLAVVKEKVFLPLKSRLKNMQAVLEIDLTLTERYDPNSMLRKCTKFTRMSSP